MVTFSYQMLEMNFLKKFLDPSISNIMNWPNTAVHTNLSDEVKWFMHPHL
jgi:hypothetical protein